MVSTLVRKSSMVVTELPVRVSTSRQGRQLIHRTVSRSLIWLHRTSRLTKPYTLLKPSSRRRLFWAKLRLFTLPNLVWISVKCSIRLLDKVKCSKSERLERLATLDSQLWLTLRLRSFGTRVTAVAPIWLMEFSDKFREINSRQMKFVFTFKNYIQA